MDFLRAANHDEFLLDLRSGKVFGTARLIGVDHTLADADEADGHSGDAADPACGGIDCERHRVARAATDSRDGVRGTVHGRRAGRRGGESDFLRVAGRNEMRGPLTGAVCGEHRECNEVIARFREEVFYRWGFGLDGASFTLRAVVELPAVAHFWSAGRAGGVEFELVTSDARTGECSRGCFSGAECEALQALVSLVAPLLLVPVLVTVDFLVVLVFFPSDEHFAERRSEFRRFCERAALVAILAGEPAPIRPAAVRLGICDRLVVLVAEPALDDAVRGLAVRVVAIVASCVSSDVRVVGVNQHSFFDGDRAVVSAICGKEAAGRAFFAFRFKAIFDFWRRDQEKLVPEIHRQPARFREFDELGLDLFVVDTDGRCATRVGRIRVGVFEFAPEVRVVVREFTRRVVVLGRNRISVFVPPAVTSEVFEILLQSRLVFRGVGPDASARRAPVDDVVGIRRHHRAAAVVEVGEKFVEGSDRPSPAQRLVADGFSVPQVHDHSRRGRRSRAECNSRDQRRQQQERGSPAATRALYPCRSPRHPFSRARHLRSRC